MKRLLTCLGLLAFVFTLNASPSTPSVKDKAKLPEKELRDLSNTIKAAEIYRKEKQAKIEKSVDSLNNAASPTEKCEFALRLAQTYRPFNTDSALRYATLAASLAQSLGEEQKIEAQIALIDAYATAGIFTEAVKIYESLSSDMLPKSLKVAYWIAGRRLYGYMKSYVEGNNAFEKQYNALYLQCDDSLLSNLPAQNNLRIFISCERLVTEGKFKEAQQQLTNLLKQLEQESNIYGMAAFQLAEVYRNYGDETEYASLLAESAISDIKGGITEGMALPTLAYWLYTQGDLDNAFSFINFALEDATQGNARMRAVSIAHLMPLIDESYRNKISSSRDELMTYFLLVTFLLVACAIQLSVMIRQIKRRKANERKLAQTSKRQESYIGNFIGLYSTYADRLNRLTKLVSLKIASGQTAELQKLIDSGKFTDQDNDDIHKIFDQAFLDIYPDFVEEINALLKDDEKIAIKTPNSLTPELRIYAFVRLGVEESTRIAQILHYSTNTVYAYRNRMRNRAVERDTFDQDVMEIGKTLNSKTRHT